MNWGDPRLPARFWDKVVPVPEAGCLMWVGATTDKGYGSFRVGTSEWLREDGEVVRKQVTAPAHKHSYETVHGPTALTILHAGQSVRIVIDHLCRNRSCVNPDHLQAVPEPINVARGTSPSAVHAAKTACPAGHAYSFQNTYVWRNKRYCRTCQKNRRRTT